MVRPLLRDLSYRAQEMGALNDTNVASELSGSKSEAIGHRQDVIEWAGDNPDKAADMVRTWMEEN